MMAKIAAGRKKNVNEPRCLGGPCPPSFHRVRFFFLLVPNTHALLSQCSFFADKRYSFQGTPLACFRRAKGLASFFLPGPRASSSRLSRHGTPRRRCWSSTSSASLGAGVAGAAASAAACKLFSEGGCGP